MGEESKPSPLLGFGENFALSGAAAIISKTAAAPIERVKLLVQNQGEMLKTGRLDKPYSGVIDCTMRTFRTEGRCWRMICLLNNYTFSLAVFVLIEFDIFCSQF